MTRELYQEYINEISLNVTSGEIDSIRKKHITKSGCRAYRDGYIGIAGTLGEPQESDWARAEQCLCRQVPYPYRPESGKREHRSLSGAIDPEAFLSQLETLLAELRKEFPQFIFSNKINRTETIFRLRNDQGLDYEDRDAITSVALLLRTLDSVNIFDTGLFFAYRKLEPQTLMDDIRQRLDAYLHPVPLPDSARLPVILDLELFGRAFERDLNGQKLHRGATLFSEKMGKKCLSETFTLSVDRSREMVLTPFFDTEGSVLPGNVLPLIENGVIRRGYADKKCAAEFSVDNTACAGGTYDSVPELANPALAVRPTGKTLAELLGDRPAVLIDTADGGDTTPDGSFASPVQCAYLYQSGRLVGRLPEFSVRGNLFDLFGDQYLGCSTDKPFFPSHALVMEMDISR